MASPMLFLETKEANHLLAYLTNQVWLNFLQLKPTGSARLQTTSRQEHFQATCRRRLESDWLTKPFLSR